MEADPTPSETRDFSLVLGGPLYQLLVRSGLIRPPLNRVGRRVMVIGGVAWLPLAVLTLLGGRFAAGVKVPFLQDFEVQCRLLAMLPLLIGAELTVHGRMSNIVAEFLARKIVTPEQRTRYQEILDAALRLRNSIPIEAGMALLVFGLGNLVWREGVSLHADAWYASVTPGGTVYTPAGYWYAFVSVPIVQFILLRWYFRLFIWCQYLWRVSRMELRLVPIHPDRSAGLGFLANVIFALAPFLLAHSVLVAGYIANRIFYQGAKLPEFKLEVVALFVLLNLLALGPLLVFGPGLSAVRLVGLRMYGRLANEYVQDFDRKWVSGPALEGEALLGSADIQSLADLANSFQIVQTMRAFPFGKEALIQLNVIILLPLLPLVLTMIPLDELVKRLVQVVL
jgi:hypothetical protein